MPSRATDPAGFLLVLAAGVAAARAAEGTVSWGSRRPRRTEDEEAAEDLDAEHADEVADAALSASARRRRRRRRSSGADGADAAEDDPPNTVVHIRDGRSKAGAADDDGVRGVKGSTGWRPSASVAVTTGTPADAGHRS